MTRFLMIVLFARVVGRNRQKDQRVVWRVTQELSNQSLVMVSATIVRMDGTAISRKAQGASNVRLVNIRWVPTLLRRVSPVVVVNMVRVASSAHLASFVRLI